MFSLGYKTPLCHFDSIFIHFFCDKPIVSRLYYYGNFYNFSKMCCTNIQLQEDFHYYWESPESFNYLPVSYGRYHFIKEALEVSLTAIFQYFIFSLKFVEHFHFILNSQYRLIFQSRTFTKLFIYFCILLF